MSTDKSDQSNQSNQSNNSPVGQSHRYCNPITIATKVTQMPPNQSNQNESVNTKHGHLAAALDPNEISGIWVVWPKCRAKVTKPSEVTKPKWKAREVNRTQTQSTKPTKAKVYFRNTIIWGLLLTQMVFPAFGSCDPNAGSRRPNQSGATKPKWIAREVNQTQTLSTKPTKVKAYVGCPTKRVTKATKVKQHQPKRIGSTVSIWLFEDRIYRATCRLSKYKSLSCALRSPLFLCSCCHCLSRLSWLFPG